MSRKIKDHHKELPLVIETRSKDGHLVAKQLTKVVVLDGNEGKDMNAVDRLNKGLDAYLPPEWEDGSHMGVRFGDMPLETARKLAAAFSFKDNEIARKRNDWWIKATREQKDIALAASRVGAEIW